MTKNMLYKTGELARLTGVSPRTVRFYDIKGILSPVEYSQSGYRMYDNSSVEKLQRILMLKYLGFSLEQIEEVMHQGQVEAHWNLMDSINEQKYLLRQKIKHMQRVLETIEQIDEKDENIWERILEVISMTEEKELLDRQYANDVNLQKRINIHDYSTSKENWMNWVYHRLDIKSGMRILELGCGTGLLWIANLSGLPENIELTLTDNSQGMIEKVKGVLEVHEKTLEAKNIKVEVRLLDAENAVIEAGSYDRIIANHMLYHVNKKDQLFRAVKNGLREDGMFCCSTVGKGHMKELNELVKGFSDEIELYFAEATENFLLENGQEQLERYFQSVSLDICESDLLVDNADVIYDYVCSYPGNAPQILKKKEHAFKRTVNQIIERDGAFYIQKSTGMFRAF